MSYTLTHTFMDELNKTLFNTSAINYFSPILESIFPNSSFGCIRAKVINITIEREDVISVELLPNKKFKTFLPGQYVELSIKINAVHSTRIFSISSSLQQWKDDHTITLSIQKQKQGKITTWIHNHLKEGDIVEISTAMGDFVLPNTAEDVVFIAGGSGITPFRSMLYKALEQKRKVTLLYYCNAIGEHLFEDELLSFNNEENINIHLIDSNSNGFISVSHLEKYCTNLTQAFTYICGPAPMIKAAQTVLEQLTISKDKIIIERFNPVQIPSKDLEHIEGTVSVINQNKNNIKVNPTSSILETLEQNGVFPKHGCRMGICKKCQCTKKSGVVYNKLTQQFSDANEERIEICSSIPVGNVELEF